MHLGVGPARIPDLGSSTELTAEQLLDQAIPWTGLAYHKPMVRSLGWNRSSWHRALLDRGSKGASMAQAIDHPEYRHTPGECQQERPMMLGRVDLYRAVEALANCELRESNSISTGPNLEACYNGGISTEKIGRMYKQSPHDHGVVPVSALRFMQSSCCNDMCRPPHLVLTTECSIGRTIIPSFAQAWN